MDEELLQRLRGLMGRVPADATRTPPMPTQPTIGPPTGTRVPASPRGVLAALQRSAQPSPDTPAGWANEMLNPVRAGAQARQFVNQAAEAVGRRQLGRAAGLGALAAMSVPGVPGSGKAAPATRIANVRDALGLRLVDVDTPSGLVRASLEQMPDGRIYVRGIQRPNLKATEIDLAAKNTLGPTAMRQLMRDVQQMEWKRPVTGWTGHRVTGANPDHMFKGKLL